MYKHKIYFKTITQWSVRVVDGNIAKWYTSQETLQNPTFSLENQRGFHKASVQLTTELQYNFRGACPPLRGMIVPCLQICPYPVNVFVLLSGTCLLCRIRHTSFILVASYVRTLHTMQSKPSSAGDSKTTVSMYAAVIRYTTVVKIEALTCSLPVLLLDRSEIVLSPVRMLSYVWRLLRTYIFAIISTRVTTYNSSNNT